MRRRVRASLCMLFAGFFLAACGVSAPPEARWRVKVLTGGPAGYYNKVCKAVAQVAPQRGIAVSCENTNGSRDNIYRLERGEADFAIVQSDVMHRAWNAEPPFEKAYGNLRLVAPLFTEKVHILQRPHLYLTGLTSAQLSGKRIWPGPRNSGSEFSAQTLLSAVGVARPVFAFQVDTSKAFALLRAGKLKLIVNRALPGEEVLLETLDSLGVGVWPSAEGASPGGAERLVVLLRPQLRINRLSDLQGKAVWLDKPGSDIEQAVMAGLSAAGETASIADLRRMPVGDAGEAFRLLLEGKLDALVQLRRPGAASATVPLRAIFSSELVHAVLGTQGIQVLPLSEIADVPRDTEYRVFTRVRVSIPELLALPEKSVWWAGNARLDSLVLDSLLPETSEEERQKLLAKRVDKLDYALAEDLLVLRELDIVFRTAVAPTGEIAGTFRETEIRPLGLDWPLIEKLVEDGSYVETSLQRSAYPSLQHGVQTAGVQALLITRLRQSPAGGTSGANADPGEAEMVRVLAEMLQEDRGAIESELAKLVRDTRTGDLTEPVSLALLDRRPKEAFQRVIHSDARGYLTTTKLRRAVWLQIGILIAALVLVGGLAFSLRAGRQAVARHADLTVCCLLCAIVLAMGAIWLQDVEGDVNDEFTSMWSAGSSLALQVGRNLQLPAEAPVPTTRRGQRVMGSFSWVVVLLIGIFVLPQVKDLRQRLIARLHGESPPPSAAP